MWFVTPKELALEVLSALVDRWISDGKDPHHEAQRLAEGYSLRAPAEAAFAAAAATKPHAPVPGSGV